MARWLILKVHADRAGEFDSHTASDDDQPVQMNLTAVNSIDSPTTVRQHEVCTYRNNHPEAARWGQKKLTWLPALLMAQNLL